jgi:octaprenyl-diphosphate synthase
MITGQELALVESALRDVLSSDVDLLCTAGELVIRSGGKRLRPTVVLLAYRASGGQDIRQAVPLATAVELLHTASLVHDDINDQSEMRRGQATVNARWGNNLALLVGDFVFVRLLGLLAECGSRAIQILGDCCTSIVEGETLQMLHQGDRHMDEALYLQIVRKKTASLFSACGQLGAVVASGMEEQIAALSAYGENLGIAFQIQDDMLDLVGQQEILGKPVFLDLDQGSASLAILHALEHAQATRPAWPGCCTTTARWTMRHRRHAPLLSGRYPRSLSCPRRRPEASYAGWRTML